MDYVSSFRNWDRTSMIRSTKSPIVPVILDGLAFSPSQFRIALHPDIVTNENMYKKALALKLLGYLRFTTFMESQYVNVVCEEIINFKSPIKITGQERRDALRIYADEAGHSLFGEEIVTSVEREFEVSAENLGEPIAIDRLNDLLYTERNHLNEMLIRHAFVVVAETLVSKQLAKIPSSGKLAPGIETLLRDHAADEASHGSYFKWYWSKLWPSLSASDKVELARVLPTLIHIYLDTDTRLDSSILRLLGFSHQKAEQIKSDTYDLSSMDKATRDSGASTLKMFANTGVLAIPGAESAFIRSRLVGFLSLHGGSFA